MAFGKGAIGTVPLAGGPLHDPPTVTLDAPTGVVSTGGPTMTVQWTYSQPQSDPQEQYRVTFENDARTVVYYDTGWRSGTDTSWTVDLDAQGIPHDTTDLTVTVGVRGPEDIGTDVAARYQADDAEPIDVEWGVPHCTIDAPQDDTVLVTSAGPTVQWSFADDRVGKTQGWYRVQLRFAESDFVVYDTGWVAGADTSHVIDFNLSDLTQYEVVVQLKNNHGIRSD